MLTVNFARCNSFALCRWLIHTKTEIHPRLLIKLRLNLLGCEALHTWINKFACTKPSVCWSQPFTCIHTVTPSCLLPAVPYLLGDFQPRLLESEDWAAVERRRDLEQGVVVVQAAADIGHRHPLLNHRHTHVDIVTVQDLCSNPVADLKNDT